MNKTFAIAMLVLAVAAIAPVSATHWDTFEKPLGSPENECSHFGYDYFVAKWEFDGEEWGVTEGSADGTSVTGDEGSVDWTADPEAGVIVKAGLDYATDEGTSGSFEKDQHDFSHITFCRDEIPEVPEFGLLGLGVLSVLGVGMIAYIRKY